jgi:hypothetical protein
MFIDRQPPACMTGKMPIPLAIYAPGGAKDAAGSHENV